MEPKDFGIELFVLINICVDLKKLLDLNNEELFDAKNDSFFVKVRLLAAVKYNTAICKLGLHPP